MEQALPEEDGSLYQVALALEQDTALDAEMQEGCEGLIADGIRGTDSGECHDASL